MTRPRHTVRASQPIIMDFYKFNMYRLPKCLVPSDPSLKYFKSDYQHLRASLI